MTSRNNFWGYKDEGEHQKIVLNKNFIHNIEQINPLSVQYEKYWKDLKRRCIEGYWFEGKWMPGTLYFYVNFAKIRLNKDNYAKTKVIARPFLRDLEWEKAYVYAEARGFSGFSEDEDNTCNRIVEICKKTENWKDFYNPPKEVFKADGSFKNYIDARKYLRRVHSRNLGKPLYQNTAKNVIDIEARGCLAEGTEILMFNGIIKRVEDIVNGDLLMGKDGTPRVVSNLYIGESELYKVNHKINSFDDFTVNSHHTFSIKKRKYINGKYVNKVRQKGYYITEYTDINIKELLKIQHKPSFRSMYSRYRINKPIEFKEGNDLLINPYFLGLWLSDGRSNCTSVKITDNILWDYLKQFCVNNMFDYKETIIKAEGNRKEAREIYIKCGDLRNDFYSYNLLNNKHIPNDYKLSDVKSRLLLLAGLIDGNGCYDTKCQNYRLYCGLNESIAQDSVFIARSLGFQSSYNKRIRDGFKDTYEVSINGDLSIVPCKLHRKQIDKINHRIDLCSSSFTLSSNGFGKYYSFSVDVDNEYLLSDFSVDHNSGKSYGLAALVAHNFFMDGATDYDELLKGLNGENMMSSETLVGAIDGRYSKDLLNKTQLIFDEMAGEQMFQTDIYPSPLKKDFNGSWFSGKQYIEAKVDKQIGGKWKRVGSGSIIYHRSFNDDPFAGNGTRGSLVVLEEVGFFSNLIESLGALKDTTYNGPNKFGVIYMTGCVCAGTKVWTNDGIQVPIEELQQSDGILGYIGKGVIKQDILWMKPPAKKPCYRIETVGGNFIECSDDHPLLYSYNRWSGKKKKVSFKLAKELEVGEQLMIMNQVPIFGDGIAWQPRLLGMLIGDGHYGKRGVELSGVTEEVFQWLNDRFEIKIKKQFIQKDGLLYRSVTINGINQEMRNAGIMGQSKSLKRLPLNSNKYRMHDICELLGGYFDADGNVYYNKKKNSIRVVLTSKYVELLNDVKELLYKLGIACTISKEYRKTGYKPGDIYRLYINKNKDVKQFKKHIKLLCTHKQNTLNQIDSINCKQRMHYDECEFVKPISNNKGTIYLNKEFSKLTALRSELITKIEYIGEQEVYNLNADITHTYISNGFVSGNTGGDMSGGSSEQAMEVFFDPERYDCLCFNDIWEESGNIGFFVPYELALNEFKDSEGNTELGRAVNFVDNKRLNLQKGKNKRALYDEMQNNPRVPSEAFLIMNANIFPVGELKEHLNYVKSCSTDSFISGENGELAWIEKDGKLDIKWQPDLTNKLTPTGFRMKKEDDTNGCITIWEHPINVNGTTPYGMYLAGCLPPGEKVMTNEGLKNIELVNVDNTLFDITGKVTNIKAFTKYYVQDGDLYTVKVSNTHRTTTFTDEHPIYASLPIIKYNGKNKRKSGLKQSYKTFDFDFVECKNLTTKHWVRVPNMYKEIKDVDTGLWINNARVDRRINNPLLNKDFWWFIGLFLGDGWTESNEYKISIAFDVENMQSLIRCKKIIKELFNRSSYEDISESGTSIELSFSFKELHAFLNLNFGKYAYGKFISEDFKRLPHDLKIELISGYLESDGSVVKSGKYYTTEFVSINLELLEAIQDMLFSLGIISSLNKLRDAKKTVICNKIVNQKETYHLRLNGYDTIKLKSFISNSEKLNKIPQSYIDDNHKIRYNKDCYLSDDTQWIYFKVKNIDVNKYTGYVHNFETADNTYMCHHLPTHNTDPYDQDQSQTSSLGSTFIYKTFAAVDGIHEWIVAEYTARPRTAEEHHETVRKLLTYYNASDLYENERNSLKMHFQHKNSLHLLAKTPTILKSTEGSKVQRQYGLHMTEQIKDELEIYVRDWLLKERGDGKLNLHTIYSTALLEELIYYNRDINTDRAIALMMTICNRLMNYHIKVEAIKEENFQADSFLQNAFSGKFFC